MANILDELKDALSSFESSVKKDLEEMREQKREVLRLRNELYDTVKNVNYVRHDGTVIVSAPNIILGNVDQHGNLIAGGGGSSVTIRANNVAIEGVGDSSAGGSITQRAASIRSIAVDPGVDGQENVVCGRSEIVCQAKGIARSQRGGNVCEPCRHDQRHNAPLRHVARHTCHTIERDEDIGNRRTNEDVGRHCKRP